MLALLFQLRVMPLGIPVIAMAYLAGAGDCVLALLFFHWLWRLL